MYRAEELGRLVISEQKLDILTHTTLNLYTQNALITVRGATKSRASDPNLQYAPSLRPKYTWD